MLLHQLKNLVSAVLLIAACHTYAEPFPPSGALEWNEFNAVRVKIRTPQGWVSGAESNEDTQAFFVSRTPVATDAPFQSGISLNVFSFPGNTPQGSLDYAKSFTIAYPKNFGEGAECGWKAGTPLSLFWCQADIASDGHTTTALHHLVANADTGKLYVFMFETLREDWQKSWPTITKMLESISVDPTY
jgi:hypothetical protein